MEDALYEITSVRLFADLSLDNPIPDHTTIMNFRHLLEKHKLSCPLFKEVNRWLPDTGIYLIEGTIVDATIIEAASSTKNKAKERGPEMHQTQKGKQWLFDLKAPIGVDARMGLTHSVSTIFMTSRKQQTFFMAKNVLSRWILAIVALKKREELKDEKVGWLITAILSKIKTFKETPEKEHVANPNAIYQN